MQSSIFQTEKKKTKKKNYRSLKLVLKVINHRGLGVSASSFSKASCYSNRSSHFNLERSRRKRNFPNFLLFFFPPFFFIFSRVPSFYRHTFLSKSYFIYLLSKRFHRFLKFFLIESLKGLTRAPVCFPSFNLPLFFFPPRPKSTLL